MDIKLLNVCKYNTFNKIFYCIPIGKGLIQFFINFKCLVVEFTANRMLTDFTALGILLNSISQNLTIKLE